MTATIIGTTHHGLLDPDGDLCRPGLQQFSLLAVHAARRCLATRMTGTDGDRRQRRTGSGAYAPGPVRPTPSGVCVQMHQQALRAFLRRLCGNAADADDLAQEAFVFAWEHIARFDPARALPPLAVRHRLAQISRTQAQLAAAVEARKCSGAADRNQFRTRSRPEAGLGKGHVHPAAGTKSRRPALSGMRNSPMPRRPRPWRCRWAR